MMLRKLSNAMFQGLSFRIMEADNWTPGSALSLLCPPIVERIGGRTKVLLDSGVRRGIDVFKALALGADAVGVGRPILYGLAVGGADGVVAVLEHLKTELVNVMRLSGTSGVADVGPELVRVS